MISRLPASVWLMLLLSGFAASEKNVSLCLTTDVYSRTLSCEKPLQIKVTNITFDLYNALCSPTAPDNKCSELGAIPPDVSNNCDGKFECVTSATDIPAVPMKCPGAAGAQAMMASVHYQCVQEVVPKVETTVAPRTTLKPFPTRQPTGSRNSKPNLTKRTDDSPLEMDDMGLVIGLSVAGGIIIIIIVIAVAIFIARNRRHNSNNSQNSTKTLASSEAGDSPPTGQSAEDVYGFAKSAEGQQERLQKRNDNIKRNLSFKSEESKNKRPPKLSKSKSKSKSSIDQLNSGSPPKGKNPKESRKAKQSTSEGKKKATPNNQKVDHVPEESKSTNAMVAPADSKSSTNLLDI